MQPTYEIPPESETGARGPTKPLRVLVVEDETMIGMLLAELLQEMGYDVCGIEATEAGAVGAASRSKPDLMIVDAHLGEGSGIAAVDEIYRTGSIPHLFVSGDIARVKALKPEAIVIQKPFHEAELARAIQRAFEADIALRSDRSGTVLS